MGLGTFVSALTLVIATAFLNAVQGTTPAARGEVTPEVDTFVRQVLADRIAAKDVPDWGLLRDSKRIAVRSNGVGLDLALGHDALPALEGYQLRLVSTAEAQTEADRTRVSVYFIAIDHLQIAGNTAGLWIGVDFTMPSDSKLLKMCCCARALEYRRIEDRWVFVRWGEGGRCY